jgi:hypothetical protein
VSLFADLARVKTEEDVKDAYIKALGLKSYFKGLVDIQTKEVWFEAKEASTPPIIMFGQLLVYVRAAQRRGEPIPAFLAVIDRTKAAIMPTEQALPMFEDKTIGPNPARRLARNWRRKSRLMSKPIMSFMTSPAMKKSSLAR